MRVMASPVIVKPLEHGWQFCQTDDGSWFPTTVPTCVHLDLLANGQIPDPFDAFNELAADWISTAKFTYAVDLPVIARGDARQKVTLVFEGLDTFATCKLNGKDILSSSNMFIPHRIDVSDIFLYSTRNTLTLDFEPALSKAREIIEANPQHKWLSFNGDPARLAVRKAQFHFGWDWNGFFSTAGPWRPVLFELHDLRISDIWTEYAVDLGPTSNKVNGNFFAAIEGHVPSATVILSISLAGQTVITQTLELEGENVSVHYNLDNVSLWYPHAYGSQPLYSFSVTLLCQGTVIDRRCKRVGFRQSELIQRPHNDGKTFYFRINGIDVFCGGSNWVPADSFVTRVSRDSYRRWVQLVVNSNQTMLRLWGGGVWEHDDLFEACDEFGVLVWQDFLFACGNYPAFDETFRSSVREEATANLRRLRHHCCIVVFAGNNEDYQVQEQNDLKCDFQDKNPESWLRTDFPARYIYEHMLPEIVQAETPTVPYLPGSPWSGGGLTSEDPRNGDMHVWDVWHGKQLKYQEYDSIGGRFNSEFGLEALPHIETIKYYCKDESQLYPQSKMLDFHNKGAGQERRLAVYMAENFRLRADLRGYIHLTQMAQAEAMLYSYRGWRKQWGMGRSCGGALTWQLNDCWPTTSWSIVDYFFRKKPAYYVVARTLAPITVNVQREHQDWSVVHARPAKTTDYELWIASRCLEEKVATVELRFIAIDTGKDIRERVLRQNVRLTANGTTIVLRGTINNSNDAAHVLAARAFINGALISRAFDWPQPFKYLSNKERGLEVDIKASEVRISATRPVKGLVFEERDGVSLSDNALDIVPGDEQVIRVEGATAAAHALKWTYLGDDE